MSQGYTKFWRKLQDSSLWLSEKFTRGQAWIDLIGLANYTDGFFRIRGNKVKVKRGQLGYSEVSLADRWRWSRGKVRRFLVELESKKEEKIVQQKNNLTTLITILNYDKYQGNDTPDGTAENKTRLINKINTIEDVPLDIAEKVIIEVFRENDLKMVQQTIQQISLLSDLNKREILINKIKTVQQTVQQVRQQVEQQTDSRQYTNKKDKNKKEKNKKEPFILPDWMDAELWDDFKESRKKLRKPMTERAEKLVLQKCAFLKEKGHNPKHLVMTAIESGWQTVYEPKTKGG